MKLPLLSTTVTTSTHTASDMLFTVPVINQVLSQAIRVYQARLRQNTSKVKTRSEIARTKKKWFRQKGTGNARHGARTPNIFVGGGVSHGPTGLTSWKLSLPQRLKHQALAMALTAQLKNVWVSEDLITMKKTKAAATLLKNVAANDARLLIVLPSIAEAAIRNLRNLANTRICSARQVTALDVVSADAIIFTPEALTALEDRMSREKVVAPKVAQIKEVKAVKVAKPAVKKVAKVAPTKAAKPAAPKKVAAKKPTTKKVTVA